MSSTAKRKNGDGASACASESNKKCKAKSRSSVPIDLNPKQQEAINAAKDGKNVFITGQGGVGKSFILETIIKHFYNRNPIRSIGVVAPTGVSAIALPNGQTIHKFSGVGIPEIKNDFGNVWEPEKQYMWRNLKVLIVDEISMISAEFLDCLSEQVCKIRKNNLPFGGIQLIFCGDFLQLPPITRSMKDIQALKSNLEDWSYNNRGFAFQSNVWKNANFIVTHLVP